MAIGIAIGAMGCDPYLSSIRRDVIPTELQSIFIFFFVLLTAVADAGAQSSPVQWMMMMWMLMLVLMVSSPWSMVHGQWSMAGCLVCGSVCSCHSPQRRISHGRNVQMQ